jgi:hypothetical protein
MGALVMTNLRGSGVFLEVVFLAVVFFFEPRRSRLESLSPIKMARIG